MFGNLGIFIANTRVCLVYVCYILMSKYQNIRVLLFVTSVSNLQSTSVCLVALGVTIPKRPKGNLGTLYGINNRKVARFAW